MPCKDILARMQRRFGPYAQAAAEGKKGMAKELATFLNGKRFLNKFNNKYALYAAARTANIGA